VDLSTQRPELFEEMMRRLRAYGDTVYQTDYSAGADNCLSVGDALERDRGFLAPRCS
jgi:hypothetical protein